MRSAVRILWRWSWVITLPVSIAFAYLLLATADRYGDFALRNIVSRPVPLLRSGELEAGHMARSLWERISSAPAARSRSGSASLPSVSLFVPEPALAQLDSNLPHSGFEYVQGGLWDGGRLREVELRYRGDNIYHWGYFKKSWRVKTKKKSLYRGLRRFNLIAPITREIVNNHLSYRLAELLGLVTPVTELVNVNINGRGTGVYILTEQLTELTLRRQGLMPGDLYSGEVYGRDQYVGVANRLFAHAGLWEKVAVNNHYDEASIAPLERMIALLRTPQTEDLHRQLAAFLDLEAFGRFSALEVLAAASHYDVIHNWRLYYDPWRQKIVPVVWDPVGWHENRLPPAGQTTRLDVITTPLHAVLHQNGDFLRARQRTLEHFFTSGLEDRFLEEVGRTIDRVDEAVGGDHNLVVGNRVQSPADARAAMARLRVTIEEMFGEIRSAYLEDGRPVRWAPVDGGLALQVNGRTPATAVTLRFARSLRDGVAARLRYWTDGQPVERDVGALLTQSGRRLELRHRLLPASRPALLAMRQAYENHLEVLPGYYELVLDGLGDTELIEVLVERGDGQLESAERADAIPRTSFDGMLAVVGERPVREPVVMQGEVLVEGVQEFDREVILRPGTTLRMGPGAAMIFRGRVHAAGTTEQPIRIVPARADQAPWGTVALQGPGASGSVFRFCEMTGGSGIKEDLFEYSAMFSVHDVDGVAVEHSSFSDSQVVDDMVHTVYSRIRFSDCLFERSAFDAVDLDITEGVVERCEFRDSGNDALDLMTSRVVVVDTILRGNQDKGISVGEDTRLLALGCRFVDNVIGVEAKDRSLAVLYNVELTGNALAVNAYDKNWQYEGGGIAYLYKASLTGNARMIEAQKRSRVRVHDSYLDRPLDPDLERVDVDKTSDSRPGTAATVRSMWRFPEEREALGRLGEEFWANADFRTRGVPIVGR